MLFKKISVSNIWRDFTTLTNYEQVISSLESIIIKWNSEKFDSKLKSKFNFDDQEFIIRFFPKKSANYHEFDDCFNPYRSYNDSIKYLFNVDEFILISSKTRINEEKANQLFSIIAPILQQIKYKFPIFINIPLKIYLKYKGIMFENGKYFHYNSFSCWGKNEDYKGFTKICNIFNNMYCDMEKLYFSGRKIIDINLENVLEPVSMKKCFYCFVDEDPVYYIRFFLHWNRKMIQNYQQNFQNVNNIVIRTKYNSKCSHKTVFHSFLKHLQYMINNNDVFEKWKTKNYKNNYYYEINKIFTENTGIKSELQFKSAPLDSILLNFAIQIVISKTENAFADLWQCFLEQIRKHFELKKVIPFVISDLPNFKYCLIYQKLQLINCCILEKTKYCFCEDEYYQLLDLYNISNDLTIGTEIKAFFKAKNPNGNIEEFSAFIKKPVNEIEQLWNYTKEPRPFLFENQAEIALYYLETLIPSEVFSQLIYVIFDYIRYDLSTQIVDTQTISEDLYKEILNSISSIKCDSIESCLDICRIIEKKTHEMTIIRSFDKKFKNKSIIKQLHEKGIFSYQQDEESTFLPNVMYKFEDIINSSKVTEESIITSINNKTSSDRNLHYLQVHSEFANYGEPTTEDKSVIATIIEEST